MDGLVVSVASLTMINSTYHHEYKSDQKVEVYKKLPSIPTRFADTNLQASRNAKSSQIQEVKVVT